MVDQGHKIDKGREGFILCGGDCSADVEGALSFRRHGPVSMTQACVQGSSK